MQNAIRIIHNEHRSLSAVLSGLSSLARLARDRDVRPDFAVFRAMIYYIDTFPERMHHPKEETYLFARLAERDPDARELIDLLRAEHSQGSQAVRELERALNEFEMIWPRGKEQFAAAVEAYANFHWNHMRREEQELLPRAERALTADDWREMQAAFAANTEPLADLNHTDFDALFRRILHLAPAPVGVGDAWRKAS